MPGKRKFVQEEMDQWTEAEKQFVELCNERKWIVDNEEGTGVPVLYPSHKSKRGVYSVSVYGMDDDGQPLMSLCITAQHGRTKEALLRKADKANLNGYIRINCDTDADYIFPIDRLPRAVRTFNLRKKQTHKGPSKETIAKAQKALAEWRKQKKENNE